VHIVADELGYTLFASILDMHLIPVGTPLVETPYDLAAQSPAHCHSIAYLRKGDLIVQRPDLLSGLIDSQQAPLLTTINLQLTIHLRIALHLQVQAPIFGVLTPRIPVQHYSGAVVDTGAQRGATGARTEILQKTGHTLTT